MIILHTAACEAVTLHRSERGSRPKEEHHEHLTPQVTGQSKDAVAVLSMQFSAIFYNQTSGKINLSLASGI